MGNMVSQAMKLAWKAIQTGEKLRIAHSNNTILLSFCLYETFAPSDHPAQPSIDKTDLSSPDSAVSGSVRQVT